MFKSLEISKTAKVLNLVFLENTRFSLYRRVHRICNIPISLWFFFFFFFLFSCFSLPFVYFFSGACSKEFLVYIYLHQKRFFIVKNLHLRKISSLLSLLFGPSVNFFTVHPGYPSECKLCLHPIVIPHTPHPLTLSLQYPHPFIFNAFNHIHQVPGNYAH